MKSNPYRLLHARLFDEAVTHFPGGVGEITEIVRLALDRPTLSRSTFLDWRLGRTAVPAEALTCAIAHIPLTREELLNHVIAGLDDDPDAIREKASALVDLTGLFRPQAKARIRKLERDMADLEALGAFDDDYEVAEAVC